MGKPTRSTKLLKRRKSIKSSVLSKMKRKTKGGNYLSKLLAGSDDTEGTDTTPTANVGESEMNKDATTTTETMITDETTTGTEGDKTTTGTEGDKTDETTTGTEGEESDYGRILGDTLSGLKMPGPLKVGIDAEKNTKLAEENANKENKEEGGAKKKKKASKKKTSKKKKSKSKRKTSKKKKAKK